MIHPVNLALLGFLPFFGSGEPPRGQPVAWDGAKIFDLPTQEDPAVTAIIGDYLDRLAALGYARERQGIWMQSEWAYLAQHQENRAAPAASLTKIATSLAVLDHWGLEHRFTTGVYGRGTLQNGVLTGDLIIQGGFDPLFVWEEAIALGNALNQLGIREITGDLILVGPLAMNFQREPTVVGALLKQALDESQWSPLITEAHAQLPPGTPRPQVKISGAVQSLARVPDGAQFLIARQSPTLAQLVKQMNIYSNNDMAEILGASLGPPAVVAQNASRLAQIPAGEIQLENASGLGVDNRLSPRAVTRLYQALAQKIAPAGMTLGDILPVMGRNRKGTLEWRGMPKGLAVKTGTLNQVSALAGIIPTRERGVVWFTVINGGPNFDRLRAEQDKLLQRLAQHWQVLPEELTPGPTDTVQLGDPARTVLTPPQS
jgi:D-alanyl-D-alanine carboxypeptidase/D-alanyl-D-alanine-endopeptidase (penicillin-binding protein 4)